MKKLILTLGFLVLGACAVATQDDFHVDENGAVGQFTMEGTVVSEAALAPYSGEPIEVVYLVVNDDGSKAFEYFEHYIEGNDSINKMVEGQLYFKLGVLQGGLVKNDATMSAEAQQKILSALESGEVVRLIMTEETRAAVGATKYTIMPRVVE